MHLPRWLIGLLFVALATSAAARTPLYEDEDVQLYYSGYLRSFTSWHKSDDAIPALDFGALALQSTIGRSELKLAAGDWLTVEAHSRYTWTMATQDVLSGGGGIGAGAGVSIAPRRTLDLSSSILSEPDHVIESDIDRLLFRLYLGDVDLSIGRQAVSWGQSNLFKVSDVWTAFSPFDLDTSQKRGIDAVRAVWSVTSTVELDLVVADRGTVSDLSGGVRATFYLGFGELYGAAAKTYEDLALAFGASTDFDAFKLRGEIMARYDLDRDEVEVPRATLGLDWFQSATFSLGGEVHLNGFGTSDGDYLTHALGEPALTRGEGYLSGLGYAGTYLTWRPQPLLTLTTSAMVNLQDPSSVLSWSATVEVHESVDLGVGGYHGLGALELGLYGHLGYLQLSTFY